MVTLVTDKTNTNLYTLANGEIACHPFEAVDDAYALVTIYHSLYGRRQDFSLQVWFSDAPNGKPLPTLPVILQKFNPIGIPYRFAVYADQADVTVDEVGWDAVFDEAIRYDVAVTRRPRREVKDHITFVTGVVGTHWINVKNMAAADNGYFLEVTTRPLD